MNNIVSSTKLFGKDEIDSEEIYHVAFTGTENYICWIGVAMASILEHNDGKEFCFHLLVDTLSNEDEDHLLTFCREQHTSVMVYFMNDEALGRAGEFERYKVDGKYVLAFIYRFFIPDVIPEKINRILYLDGDVVCNGNLCDFIDMDLTGHCIAASEDVAGEKYALKFHLSKYFNSGMLLIDCPTWRGHHITEVLLDKIMDYSTQGKELGAPDQDLLNIVLQDKVLFVSHAYNLPFRLVRPSFFKPKIQNEDPMQARLIHFIGAYKPWTTYNQARPIVQVWARAKAHSPWRDVPLHESKGAKQYHQAARDARERGAWGEMLTWYWKFLRAKLMK